MFKKLKDIPIKRKFLYLGLAVTSIAIVFLVIILSLYEAYKVRKSLINNLTIMSRMVAGQSTAAIVFNDRQNAQEILQILVTSPDIVYAAIYKKNGELFAEYRASRSESIEIEKFFQGYGYDFSFKYLSLTVPIYLDKEEIGYVYIRSNLNEFYKGLISQIFIIVFISFITIGIIYLMIIVLERNVATPVVKLAELMSKISKEKDYSLRTPIISEDEIGILSKGFNEMLSEIEKRDKEINLYRLNLEDEVRKRTKELEDVNIRLQREFSERLKMEEEQMRLQLQLIQAQKMELVGQLAGGIAHDFNNMLTAIMGSAELLRLNLDKEDSLKNYVDLIMKSSEKASNLVQQLLAFGRRQIMNPKPLNINNILKDIEAMLSILLGENIEIKLIPSNEELVIYVDKVQIEQVLINLATNAKDAMPDGGILTIQVDSVKIDDEFIKMHGYGAVGHYALISISDTGIGMDEYTKERIFEPFFTTKGTGKGTGLGLAMVYGIIKQHNGYIDIYSEKDKGTTFKIYLPIIHTSIKEEKSFIPLDIKEGKETILLAEDINEIRDLIKTFLTKFGYNVITACDGEEAVSIFRKNKEIIALLVFDVVMPKKSGKDAYKEILKIKQHVKVIFMSGYAPDALFDKEILGGDVVFLPKPIMPHVILRKIREILDTT